MTIAVSAQIPVLPAGQAPIRVMIVDDAAVARGLLRRWLEDEQDLELVASLHSGREAIDTLGRANPDVVVLDVEMPDLDGIAALPLLLKKKPDLAVIMASALTRHNAEVTLKALSLGALDYIAKPDALGGITTASYRHDLVTKIRTFGMRARQGALRAGMRAQPRPATPLTEDQSALPLVGAPSIVPLRPFTLRPMPKTPPRVLVVGSSTGGPQALSHLCARLGPVIDRAPVLITQHMPPTFTTIMAEHLARSSGRAVREAEDGEAVRAGQVYVAPGGRHMRVARRDGNAVIVLDDSPPINFCRPAVDALFSSASATWGAWVLGVILTGMGADGTHGAAEIVQGGGGIIAQDEATSVIWGMPGSAAEAGLCSAVLPLDTIAARVAQLFGGPRP